MRSGAALSVISKDRLLSVCKSAGLLNGSTSSKRGLIYHIDLLPASQYKRILFRLKVPELRKLCDRIGVVPNGSKKSSFVALAMKSSTKPRSKVDIDLFTGAGGLSLGLVGAGGLPTFFHESDSSACDTLEKSINSKSPTLCGKVIRGKVEAVDWNDLQGRVRILLAGAPCQPFSQAGKHQANQDARNLFPVLIKSIDSVRPDAIVLENVQGLLRESVHLYFQYILNQLQCLSVRARKQENWMNHHKRIRRTMCSVGYEPEYSVSWRLLDAADYGVPQRRQRVFIVAIRTNLPQYRFPVPTHSRAALVAAQGTKTYWDERGRKAPSQRIRSGNRSEEDDGLLPWATVRDTLSDLPEPAGSEEDAILNHWVIRGARRYAGHSGSEPDWPSKAIKAGVHGVPGGENTLINGRNTLRYYTLRECAAIQTFPNRHEFAGSRKRVTRQIGNAVPPKLATAVLEPLMELLVPQ